MLISIQRRIELMVRENSRIIYGFLENSSLRWISWNAICISMLCSSCYIDWHPYILEYASASDLTCNLSVRWRNDNYGREGVFGWCSSALSEEAPLNRTELIADSSRACGSFWGPSRRESLLLRRIWKLEVHRACSRNFFFAPVPANAHELKI